MDVLTKSIGSIALVWAFKWLSFTVLKILYTFKLARPKDLRRLAGANWALITGSTDGIGKAYAFELAKRGFNIVLVARNEGKLEATAQEILALYEVKVKTIVFDFSIADVSVYEEKLLKPLSDLEIGVLVNNVGCSYEYPDRLDLIGLERLTDVCITNIIPLVLLSAHLLGKMVECKSGIVINMASSAAILPIYNWGVYSASKKFVIWLSEILRKEYANTGVHIQTVFPMLVATKMSRLRQSLMVPDADVFAREALNTLGHISEITGYFWHEIQVIYLLKLPPTFVFDHLVKKNAQKVKQKALKKLNELDSQLDDVEMIPNELNGDVKKALSVFAVGVIPINFLIFIMVTRITRISAGTIVSIMLACVPLINPICTLLLVGQFRQRFFRIIRVVPALSTVASEVNSVGNKEMTSKGEKPNFATFSI